MCGHSTIKLFYVTFILQLCGALNGKLLYHCLIQIIVSYNLAELPLRTGSLQAFRQNECSREGTPSQTVRYLQDLDRPDPRAKTAVSYTHLTLPTIYSV